MMFPCWYTVIENCMPLGIHPNRPPMLADLQNSNSIGSATNLAETMYHITVMLIWADFIILSIQYHLNEYIQ